MKISQLRLSLIAAGFSLTPLVLQAQEIPAPASTDRSEPKLQRENTDRSPGPDGQDSSTAQPNLDRSQLPTPPAVTDPVRTDDAARSTDARPADPRPEKPPMDMKDGMHHKLVAVLIPTEGNEARGVVIFESVGSGGVRVTANVTGLEPNSKHAIHVHEFGDISSPDGTSAGSHFNPTGKKHGLPEEAEHHPGDLGNLDADEKGNAMKTMTVSDLSLSGDSNAIIGRAVIIHADEDKGTQPTGDAGARIAQGVIAVANPGAASKTGAAGGDPSASVPVRDSREPNSGAADEIEAAAEQIGKGAGQAARTTVRVIERGAEEVGEALKDVGREVKKAVR